MGKSGIKSWRFVCEICGEEVGRLEVAPDRVPLPFMVGPEGHQGDLDDGVGTRIQWTYHGLWVRRRNDAESRRAVKLLEKGAPGLVKRIDPDLIPYFCRQCACWYCSKHWTMRVEYEDDEPGNPYRTSIHYGSCPKGHRRELFELR